MSVRGTKTDCTMVVVYNHNLRDLEDRWLRDSHQLIVKLQYAFRY